MIRGAILTLGATVMLAGLGAVRADDLFISDWPFLRPALPETDGLFPKLPQNWADLPLHLHVSESVGYNSNIGDTATGGTQANSLFIARPIGALESISNYGVSFQHQIGAHVLSADFSGGFTRYLNHPEFNTRQNSWDLGDSFTYSKCSGSLRVSGSTAQSLLGQQLGFNILNNNVVNSTTTLGAVESASCAINGEYTGVFNSGVTESTNSALLDKINDLRAVFVAAGITYAAQTNTLQVLATVEGADYINALRTATAPALLSNLTTDQVTATYTKTLGPTLSFSAQLGVTGFSSGSFSFAVPHTILPEYSFNVSWTPTSKLSLNASVSRSAATPTSVLSNLQVTESALASVSYSITPKMSAVAKVITLYSAGAVAVRREFV